MSLRTKRAENAIGGKEDTVSTAPQDMAAMRPAEIYQLLGQCLVHQAATLTIIDGLVLELRSRKVTLNKSTEISQACREISKHYPKGDVKRYVSNLRNLLTMPQKIFEEHRAHSDSLSITWLPKQQSWYNVGDEVDLMWGFDPKNPDAVDWWHAVVVGVRDNVKTGSRPFWVHWVGYGASNGKVPNPQLVSKHFLRVHESSALVGTDGVHTVQYIRSNCLIASSNVAVEEEPIEKCKDKCEADAKPAAAAAADAATANKADKDKDKKKAAAAKAAAAKAAAAKAAAAKAAAAKAAAAKAAAAKAAAAKAAAAKAAAAAEAAARAASRREARDITDNSAKNAAADATDAAQSKNDAAGANNAAQANKKNGANVETPQPRLFPKPKPFSKPQPSVSTATSRVEEFFWATLPAVTNSCIDTLELLAAGQAVHPNVEKECMVILAGMITYSPYPSSLPHLPGDICRKVPSTSQTLRKCRIPGIPGNCSRIARQL
jgi:hypothetical protein